MEAQMQRSTQEIFNVVLAAGFYAPHQQRDSYETREYVWMCHALDNAYDEGMITAAELNATKNAIYVYTSAGGEEEHPMCEVLFALGKVSPNECTHIMDVRPMHCPEQLLAIYMDWENRPELPEGLYDAYDNTEY